jgi:hypothetical protein
MAVKRHKLVETLAQAADALILAASDDDQSTGRDTLKRFGYPQFVLSAMAPGKQERRIETTALPLRRDGATGRLQRPKIRPEALYEMDCSFETVRQPKAGFSSQEENTLTIARHRNGFRLEWMKQCLGRFAGHSSIPGW